MKRDEKLHISQIDTENSRQLKEFIRIPYHLYRDDPAWIPPLEIERRMHLSGSNPYFRHAECAFWTAFKNGRAVGRISAQKDRLHLEQYRDHSGFFGMFESENNPETVRILFETAEEWLMNRGMKQVMGPFNLSINQECGLLVDGFDTPPSMMMGHALPWYRTAVESLGYTKAKDLLAYTINPDREQPRAMARILDMKATGMRTRGIDKSELSREMDSIFSIFNDAWSENWGFIPFTREEYMDIGRTLSFFADRRLVRIAEVKGQPAAFIVVLPNINEAIRDLGGRLLPTGWARLIYRLRIKHPRSGRILLMGVRKKYRDTLTGAALAYSLFSDISHAVRKLGMETLELSWILEDNTIMRDIIESLGGRIYKRYRIYKKTLGGKA